MTEDINQLVIERGIIYAEKEGYRPLELDVYRPATADAPLPVMLYIHGGGWRVSHKQKTPRETRSWEPSLWHRMVAAGFVVAAVEYRFSAEALYPAAIDDCLDALRFVCANAPEWGADPGKVVVFGQSAGGYLAAATGLQRSGLPVCGVICWYPLTDFSVFADDESAAIFPSQFLGAPLSAVANLVQESRLGPRARPDAPPMLLQHGTADTMAPYGQSVLLHDALVAVGAPVTLETVEGAGHFFEGSSDVAAIFDRAMAFASACVD